MMIMLPEKFISSVQSLLGAEAEPFLAALQAEAPVSVRVNRKAPLRYAERVPWHPDGYYLPARPQFTLDPLLHAGCYYVQEASSMFLYQVLERYVAHDAVVLDLCAAPGGKSTLLSEWLGEEGLLVSNEVVRQRAFILSENLQKWGNGNTVVTHNFPEEIGERLEGLFDCVLVDAPCSGEGMFRKDPKTVEEWSPQNVLACADRQKSIVRHVWNALRPGGVLVYSTCTYNPCENEGTVEWIRDELGAELLPVPSPAEWGVTETVGYHFYPHKTRGEGFYICALRKNDSAMRLSRIKPDRRKAVALTDTETGVLQWLQHPERWTVQKEDRFLLAYSAKHKPLIDYIRRKLICITTGIGLAEVRGSNLVPQHSLALAKDFRKEMFTAVELPLEQALAYLRSEALNLQGKPSGVLLMTYQGIPLGFVKNVGNHCNNLYPKEWRIRRQITASDVSGDTENGE